MEYEQTPTKFSLGGLHSFCIHILDAKTHAMHVQIVLRTREKVKNLQVAVVSVM